MSNELERWASSQQGGMTRYSATSRETGRRAQVILQEAGLKRLEIDATASVTARAMERVVDVDNYRRRLAAGDEQLNSVLAHIEMGYINTVTRIMNGM